MILGTLDINILSFIILAVIYANSHNKLEKYTRQYKIFRSMIIINMTLIVVDALSWLFNGQIGYMNVILNNTFNFFLYALEIIPPALCLIYADYQIMHDERRLNRLSKILTGIFILNLALTITSLFTGWFFNIDMNNLYNRGRYFGVHVVFCYGILIYSFCFINIKRKIIERKIYKSLLVFFVPMAVGTTIQVIFYGISLNWTGMMLSLLIIYFNIQNRGLSTDYLTGIYNRRQLDEYIRVKIKNSDINKSFSAILIDLNEFKHINDKFGHKIGDEALKDTVEIIKRSLKKSDFIARFGGDEFVIVLDVNNVQILYSIVKRIKENVKNFNSANIKPYNIGLSMGYDVYNFNSNMKADEFFKHIDMLMYKNKNRKVDILELEDIDKINME